MNRSNNFHEIKLSNERSTNMLRVKKVGENPFLSYSEQTIDDFFSMLNKIPSPLKEAVFVKFCLTGGIVSSQHNFLH